LDHLYGKELDDLKAKDINAPSLQKALKGSPRLPNFGENNYSVSPTHKQSGSPLQSGRDTGHKSFVPKKSPTNIHGKYETVKVQQKSAVDLNPQLKPNFFKNRRNDHLEAPSPLKVEEKISFNPLTSAIQEPESAMIFKKDENPPALLLKKATD